MSITAGQTIVASDFKTSSAGSSDSGKAIKLDAEGQMDPTFLKSTTTCLLAAALSGTSIDFGAITVKANKLGLTKTAHLKYLITATTVNASSTTWTLKVGSTTIGTLAGDNGDGQTYAFEIDIYIQNNNATNSQRITTFIRGIKNNVLGTNPVRADMTSMTASQDTTADVTWKLNAATGSSITITQYQQLLEYI